jgi:hypothetical protein
MTREDGKMPEGRVAFADDVETREAICALLNDDDEEDLQIGILDDDDIETVFHRKKRERKQLSDL